MEGAKIVLICIVSAVVYGVAHDQITARVCVEYFTIGHPPVFATHSPTLLALGWGVIATWWVGLLLGVPAALVCRTGTWPKRAAADLIRPISKLLAAMAAASLFAGLIGYLLARGGLIQLVGPLAERVPPGMHNRFLFDLWAHLAAYGVGFVGGVAVCVSTFYQRKRLNAKAALQATVGRASSPSHEA